MADVKGLVEDAAQFARQAVQCDQQGLVDTAIFYYTEAGQALNAAAATGAASPDMEEKSRQYMNRAEQLRNQGHSVTSFSAPAKSKEQLDMDRASFLIQQAFQEDEAKHTDEAFELYAQAAELCLRLSKITTADTQKKVTKLAQQALDRAEELKQSSSLSALEALEAPSTSVEDPDDRGHRAAVTTQHQQTVRPRPLGDALRDASTAAASSGASAAGGPGRGPAPSGGAGAYSKEEIQVLRTTSYINGREYVPFLDVDLREKFAYPVTFSDKHGFLALAPKQKERLGKWSRPEDFCQDPTLIYAVSSFSIKQTIVSDCSFVASLAISAQYERRFKKKLITSIIYPQNRKGEPVFNPCGKYMIKLQLNGVHRKVVIDDYLPVSRSGELLCSYSNNRNELWVSLLEKAYMKVMGGYDFPGSNSNIDLHALTGWIPERIAIRLNSDEFNPDKEFDRIFERFHRGHCLITIATGVMSEADGERAGLVPTHAYAMLDIRKELGKRVFQLKNPWAHCRWKGNFSEKDVNNWTADMKKALKFDPNNAELVDNGIFWIDYESVLKFYDVIYINWNPDLFSHTTCFHHTWKAKEGPKRDVYNIGDNPQYHLEVKTSQPSAVWLLLTRHITDKDDFANNKEFITLLVYKTNGKRIFYPSDPPPYKDGVRINSPHYLCKMVEQPGSHVYTLVVSQYEKNNTIHFTLRAYSTCPFKLNKIAEPYNPKYEKQVTGQWTGRSAGGCTNYPESHSLNPVHQLRIDNSSTDNMILVELRGPKQYSVGIKVLRVSENVSGTPQSFERRDSGDYRRGFSVLQLDHVPGGVYNITPSTFYPKQEGPYFLNVSSSAPVTLTTLR